MVHREGQARVVDVAAVELVEAAAALGEADEVAVACAYILDARRGRGRGGRAGVVRVVGPGAGARGPAGGPRARRGPAPASTRTVFFARPSAASAAV